jgi:hypothetical protein
MEHVMYAMTLAIEGLLMTSPSAGMQMLVLCMAMP